MTRLTALLTTLGLLGSLAACGSSGSQTGAGSHDTNSISFMLDWTANTNHIGLYLAQALGYYKAAGINVSILPAAQSGAETAVQTGVADVGFTTLSNVAAVDAQGSDLHFVFDLTQRPVAQWCALASRQDIHTPKDFDGKTFVSFGSAEQTAVVRQMVRDAGGKGDFSSVTVGTSTFQTLSNGKGDFGGFYSTWEGVQSRLNGPKLHCFQAADWGVPGNPDQLGFAVSRQWEKTHQKLLGTFIQATARGYAYALAHPEQAADLLVKQATSASLPTPLTRASMQEIASGNYWGDTAAIAKQSIAPGSGDSKDVQQTAKPITGLGQTNLPQAQAYLDFLWRNGVYRDKASGKNPAQAPQASSLATNRYVSPETE